MLIDKRKLIKLVAISLLLLLSRCCCCHQQLTALWVRSVARPRKWALMLHIICCSLSVPRQLCHPSSALTLHPSWLTTIFFGACFCFAQFVEPFTTNVTRARPPPRPAYSCCNKKVATRRWTTESFLCTTRMWRRGSRGKGEMDSECQTKWNETSWGCRRWQGRRVGREGVASSDICCCRLLLMLLLLLLQQLCYRCCCSFWAAEQSLLVLILMSFAPTRPGLIFSALLPDPPLPTLPTFSCPAHAPIAWPPTICFCFICVFAFCF